MRLQIEKILQHSLTIFCLLFLPQANLTADNSTNLELYLTELALTGQLNDPTGEIRSLLLYLNSLSPSTRAENLFELQPSWYGVLNWSTQNTLVNANKIINNNLLARIREYRCSSACECFGCLPYRNFWVAAMGGHLQQNRLQQLPAFHSNDWGLVSGLDFVLSDWLSVGIGGGYTHTDLKWDDLRGHNSIHNFYIGPYAAWNCGGWVIDASILKAAQSYRSNRHVHFAFVNRKSKSTHYGDSILGHLGTSYHYSIYMFEFAPYLTADYVYMHLKSIKEKGAHHLDFEVNSQNAQFFQGEVGTAFSGTYVTNSVIVVPTIKFGFQNITPTVGTKLRGHLAHHPGSFSMETTKDPIYQWTTGLFVNLYLLDCAEISFSYNGAWGNKRRQYYYTAELDWSF